jgi:hypothetical protein
MLTPLDEVPWHQLATTFDHVGSSDPRFFDRLWFAASDRQGNSALQFTMGVYQNMNVVDGGVVAIVDGHQHNLRVSRQLRPHYDTSCGPLRIEVLEPLKRLRLQIAEGDHDLSGELEWTAVLAPQEEHQHYRRLAGRVLEDYSRYDQIGTCAGWVKLGAQQVEVDSWWACRDHSWGIRERVGIPEPVTGEDRPAGSALFAFLFFSTDARGGHVQVARALDGSQYLSASIVDRSTGARVSIGERADIAVEFVDHGRPRRMREVTFAVTSTTGERTTIEVEAQGPAVAMPGLGYGGYNDGLGLGVWRGISHTEYDVWDVSRPAEVGFPDGTVGRPVHRIQPVSVVEHGPGGVSRGTGSLTFIAEGPLDGLSVTGASSQ